MSTETEALASENKSNPLLRVLAIVFFAVLMFETLVFIFFAFFGGIYWVGNDFQKLLEAGSRYASVSFAASVALSIILSLRYTVGPIEFEGLGFKFRGASGPVVLWVFCFLAVIGGLAVSK